MTLWSDRTQVMQPVTRPRTDDAAPRRFVSLISRPTRKTTVRHTPRDIFKCVLERAAGFKEKPATGSERGLKACSVE